jgi:hypothetical protein
MKTYRGVEVYLFLDMSTRRRSVVCFSLRPFYSYKNILLYPVQRRLCEAQIRSERCETVPLLEMEPPVIHQLVDKYISTEVPSLWIQI